MTSSPDRLFPADPATRTVARELYERVADLPIFSPHTHIDPWVLADDRPFPDATALLVTSDHYVVRILMSQGVRPAQLGIRRRDGRGDEPVATSREAWRTFATNWHLFRGTPTRLWIEQQLETVFGVEPQLDGATADPAFDRINELLGTPEFAPRALFVRFGVEWLATTDSPDVPLDAHEKLHAYGWGGRVAPTFRPDTLVQLATPGWREAVQRIGELAEVDTTSYSGLLTALQQRRQEFVRLGATATDHGPARPLFRRAPQRDVETIFDRALRDAPEPGDAEVFEAHLLTEFARMSADDGLVMQLHPGSTRNHDRAVFEAYGADIGADIPHPVDFLHGLDEVLNDLGNDPRFRLVVFTLDEAALGRELAPLAAHYPALRLGAPWWFYDSPDGMRRHHELVSETAGFYNGAGFNDDARNFVSIPARHDVARRADCSYLAGLVTTHRLGLDEALDVARLWAHDQAHEVYDRRDAR